MADEKKYNIISVNSDDDEIVIEAGARKRSQQPRSDQDAVREEDVAAPEPTDEGEEGAEPAATPAQTPAEEAKPPAEDDGYQETTLEDLKSEGPMTRMRLIILGLALLVLVAFLIYYNFLR